MSTAFSIFARDLKRILRNPVALIVTLGVAAIPALYAWFNVAASWDPYGNTKNIKVAVVNADEGTTNELVGELNAGSLVLDALHENHDLGWTYEDEGGSTLTEDEAREGVESGTYYAAIVIPKSFSADLASIASGTFTKPSITYYINEVRNTVVPEITNVGAETIQTQITEQFVSTVSATVTSKLQDAGVELTEQADTATSTLAAKVRAAKDTLNEGAGKMRDLEGTIASAKDASASAATSLDSLTELTGTSSETLAQATDLLGSTRSAATSLQAQLTAGLTKGATTLAGVSSQANAAVGKLNGKVSEAQGTISGALGTAQSVVDANAKLADELEQALAELEANPALAGHLGDAQVALQELREHLSEQQATLERLRELNQSVGDAASSMAGTADALNTAIQTGTGTVTDASSKLTETALPQLNDALDTFAGISGSLEGTLAGLAPTIEQAKGVLAQLDDTLDQTTSSVELVRDALAGVSDTMERVATDIEALSGVASAEGLSQLLSLDAQGIADFMNSPVTLDTEVMYPVYKYGSAAAPFYTNLAIWVGGFVLIAIYKQEVDTEGIEGRISPWQAYAGRGMLYVLIGQLQAIIVCVGDVIMGIQCASPVAFVFAGMVQSFVYVNIIFALACAFKHIGKALAVVLVILQIPGSSGLYPIEMMPSFFRAVEPWLPFTYGIRAMREAIAGFYGNHYAVALLQLLVFVLPALLVGIAARRRLVNINALFDKRLAATEMMVCEEEALETGSYKLTSMVKMLMDTEDYAGAVARKAAAFELAYPRRRKIATACLACIPAGLLVLLFLLEEKIPVLMIWVLSCVALCFAIIVLEYVHDSLTRRSVLARMPREQVEHLISEKLNQELVATVKLGGRGPAPAGAARAGTQTGAGRDAAQAAAQAQASPAEPAPTATDDPHEHRKEHPRA